MAEAHVGFEEKAVRRGDDGCIQHAELRLSDGLIMFGGVPTDTVLSSDTQPPVTIYAVVSDPDGHYERGRAGSAEFRYTRSGGRPGSVRRRGSCAAARWSADARHARASSSRSVGYSVAVRGDEAAFFGSTAKWAQDRARLVMTLEPHATRSTLAHRGGPRARAVLWSRLAAARRGAYWCGAGR